MIAVLGSVNMDVVTEMPRIPRPGETVLAGATARYPGGKGANQAVAAARMGESVAFFGKVGADPYGDELVDCLIANGIDTSGVERPADTPTGLATILVDERGENAIAVSPGANSLVDASYVDRVYDRLASADVILLQFEIPLATIRHLLNRLPADRPIVIVDPAPAQRIEDLPLERIDVLTPNRTELMALTGREDIEAGGRALLELGVRAVICKAGKEGAYWVAEEVEHVAPMSVRPLDTTAAGDAFNGALAATIGDLPLETAICWANAAGALATTQRGAQPSLPYREAVVGLLESQLAPTSEGR